MFISGINDITAINPSHGFSEIAGVALIPAINLLPVFIAGHTDMSGETYYIQRGSPM
jgi:hypothetical protein